MKTATYTRKELEKVGYELVNGDNKFMRKCYYLNDGNEFDYCFKTCDMIGYGRYEMTYFLNTEIYKPEKHSLEEYLKGIEKACKEFKKDLEALEKNGKRA